VPSIAVLFGRAPGSGGLGLAGRSTRGIGVGSPRESVVYLLPEGCSAIAVFAMYLSLAKH
jgi:hypothetical protein